MAQRFHGRVGSSLVWIRFTHMPGKNSYIYSQRRDWLDVSSSSVGDSQQPISMKASTKKHLLVHKCKKHTTERTDFSAKHLILSQNFGYQCSSLMNIFGWISDDVERGGEAPLKIRIKAELCLINVCGHKRTGVTWSPIFLLYCYQITFSILSYHFFFIKKFLR